MTSKPNCVHSGTVIPSVTHWLNAGSCMPCRDPFRGIKGTKHRLGKMNQAEAVAELAARGTDANSTFHRWLRFKSRLVPGERLVRFCSELQNQAPVVIHGVVWQGYGVKLSGVVTRTEWLLVRKETSLGNEVRFATPAEIPARSAVRDEVRTGDHVLHYRNDTPEGIAEDRRMGLVMVRNRHCVLRVRIERKRGVRGPHRDLAQLDLALAQLCRT